MGKQDRPSTERYVERLTLNQRIQHFALITSFSMLALTGLPVRYPESFGASIVIHLLGGFAMRSMLHRIAAVLLIALTGYHICYSLLTPRGRSELKALMPNPKDLFDAIGMTFFLFGFTQKRPEFDRYNFIEKFEYLAVGWGSVVMIGTGLVLWFQSQAMIYLPKWVLDVARVIHSYEALLAFLAIAIWHFYHVHFNPQVFPMSRIWLTGKISEHELLEHHPLEYARTIGSPPAGADPADAAAEPAPDAEVLGGKRN